MLIVVLVLATMRIIVGPLISHHLIQPCFNLDCTLNCSFIAHGKVYYNGEKDLNADDIQAQSDIFVQERLTNNIHLVEREEVIKKMDPIDPSNPTFNGIKNDSASDQKGRVGYSTYIFAGSALVAFLGIAISFVIQRNLKYEEEIWDLRQA